MTGIMEFTILGSISEITTFASGREIRELARLQKTYGAGRWRKCKGIATVRLADGTIVQVEVHLYECHGIGRREVKIKHFLET
jgi:hypothetical protein